MVSTGPPTFAGDMGHPSLRYPIREGDPIMTDTSGGYGGTAASYPATFTFDPPERVANWRPLVQWLLAIPYLIVASILYWLTGILTFVAFFTILFTKRIPREMFELMLPGLRWNLRGNAYAYFLTDRYPPFVFG